MGARSHSTAHCPPLWAVSRAKEGNHTRYAISDLAIFVLCDQVCGGVRRQLQELDTILQGDRPSTAISAQPRGEPTAA